MDKYLGPLLSSGMCPHSPQEPLSIPRDLAAQGHLVLGTSGPDGPRASLMAFAMGPTGTIYLATRRGSRKFRNLLHDPRVSLLLDDRDPGRDPIETQALTLDGAARILAGREADQARRALADRHAHLAGILHDPDTALVAVDVVSGLHLHGPDQAIPLS